MKKTLLTFLLGVLTQFLFSQQGPLLQKFKYRISNFRAINYSLSGNSQFSQSELGSGTRRYTYSSGGVGAKYYAVKSTDRILLTTSGSIYSSAYSNKQSHSGEITTGRSFNVVPGVSVLNKWFSEKNVFTELGVEASSYIRGNKDVSSKYPDPSKNKQADYSVAINTGIGKGRLENITDMQNALWLYKDLQEENLLSRPLTDDELNELGQSITKGNNTRVLDFRKRTQFILKTVDNFFQQKQLINKTDINYFTHLNDILFFAINNPRLSGTEKFIRFTPAISGGNGNQTQSYTIDKYEQRYNTGSLLLTSGLSKYVPVNLVHQNNYGASVKLAVISKHNTERGFTSGVMSSETKLNTTLKQAGINLFYQHAIYPNTRTTIIFDVKSQEGYQDLGHNTNFYAGVDVSAICNYFISYRTRFTVNIGSSFQRNMYYNGVVYFEQLPNNFHLNANVGLDVSL